jgi:hypothetical protein
MYVARHAATVKQGQVVFADPAAWRAAVARHEGRQVWVTVKRQQHLRTMPQNKYYWSVVVETIAGHIGEGREDTHELLKQQFLTGRDIELLDGQHLKMPPSTTRLNTEQFSQYVENVKRWASSFLGLYIPDANQVEVSL